MPQNLRTVTPEYAKKVYGIVVTPDAPPPFRDEPPTLMPAPKRQKKIDVIWSDGTMPPLTNDEDAKPPRSGDLF
jgi:hypothetical protein